MPSGQAVELYIYDLTRGLARQYSPFLLGKQIEGVWHTSVVVDGVEHYFGYGIQRAVAGTTHFGRPLRKLLLGNTEIDANMREELLTDLSNRYRPQDYSLLFHNCNTFSNEFGLMLTGMGVPEEILSQAQEVLTTPLGEMLTPMLLQMEGQMRGMREADFAQQGIAP